MFSTHTPTWICHTAFSLVYKLWFSISVGFIRFFFKSCINAVPSASTSPYATHFVVFCGRSDSDKGSVFLFLQHAAREVILSPTWVSLSVCWAGWYINIIFIPWKKTRSCLVQFSCCLILKWHYFNKTKLNEINHKCLFDHHFHITINPFSQLFLFVNTFWIDQTLSILEAQISDVF